MIDTHAHLDDSQFDSDRAEVVCRAKQSGINRVLVPSTSVHTAHTTIDLCNQYPDYTFPMLGLHPEEVRGDYLQQLAKIKEMLNPRVVAIGEVGLDYYWSREFECEQLDAFERQIEWSIEYNLPLMLHVRKAQNEAVKLMRRYEKDLKRGGVFHCFSGNPLEAAELLSFKGFCLGIGGILTFKKSNLPETLRTVVPLERIVLETDAPYLAPFPMRGKRNESSFIPYIVDRLAEVYEVDIKTVAETTTATAMNLFFPCV